MPFIYWALIAMVGQGIMALFLRLALRSIAPEAAVVITNSMLVAAGVVWAMSRGVSIPAQLGWNTATLFLGLAGLLIIVGILSFYKALSLGPVSVVVPIFSLNLAIAVVLGAVVLNEPLSATRVLGVALAGVSILLLTR